MKSFLLRVFTPGILCFLAMIGLFWLLNADPATALTIFIRGAFGSASKLAYVVSIWVPVSLCAAGLAITFSAGIWNIGVEGQIGASAVIATAVLQMGSARNHSAIMLVLAALCAMAAGGVWAALSGCLKQYGQISEIFSGLGLNFIMGGLTVYLVMGPWKRPGIGSTSGTEPLPSSLWLPGIKGLKISFWELALCLAGIFLVAIALNKTYAGLRLKALGLNMASANRLGIDAGKYFLAAFGGCGALAGLAGFILVTGANARHNLFPLISGGYGYLAILIALLASRRPVVSAALAFIFTAISMGGLQLSISMQLDSSIGGVIQGILTLIALLVGGYQNRSRKAKT